jgi:phosphosulfolactate phosphohydrolase-like enzyme
MRISIRQGFEPRTSRSDGRGEEAGLSSHALPDVSVFIDVVRAATTLAALLSRRPREVLATNERAVVERLRGDGYLLVSEVFDGGYDNSPTQLLTAPIDAATRVVHKSTNLTTMIFAGRPFVRAMVCGFANLGATAARVRALAPRHVEIVPSGHRGKEAMEDTACAEMLAAALVSTGGDGPAAIPGHARILAHFAELKRTRPEYPEHYWRDLDVAFSVDAFGVAIEATALAEDLMRMTAVEGGAA